MSIDLFYHSPYSRKDYDSKDLVNLVNELLQNYESEKVAFF
jgi:hypothetical protein